MDEVPGGWLGIIVPRVLDVALQETGVGRDAIVGVREKKRPASGRERR